jgi:hypothetical protein
MAAWDLLHSLLDYECLPSTVTDLILNYESVTSASVVCWLTLHSWTLNPTQLLSFWTLLRLQQCQINYVSSLCNFRMSRIEITNTNSSSSILCLSVTAETCVNFIATVWFSRVYNFQFSYPWKMCSVTGWFPRINLSTATHLSIRFLETTYMSHYLSQTRWWQSTRTGNVEYQYPIFLSTVFWDMQAYLLLKRSSYHIRTGPVVHMWSLHFTYNYI